MVQAEWMFQIPSDYVLFLLFPVLIVAWLEFSGARLRCTRLAKLSTQSTRQRVQSSTQTGLHLVEMSMSFFSALDIFPQAAEP